MARKRKKAGKKISARRNKQKRKTNRFFRGQPSNAKREIRHRLKELFGGCCQVCGYDRTFRALEFHHVHAKQKESSVSRMVSRSGYPGALAEALKCILVCANCHREIEEDLVDVPRDMVRKQIATVVNNLEKEVANRSSQSA